MHRRWLTRALIALALPALTVTAQSATAAGAAPDVPSIDAVAGIYPHLQGGQASESTSKVYGPGKKCKTGKAIKGAGARTASYSPDYSSGDPDVFEVTGEHPSVYVSSLKFRSAKAAIAYLHGYAEHTKHCPVTGPGGNPGDPGVKVTMKKIRFSLGDERWGYQMRMVGDDMTMVMNTLFVRDGKYVVYTGATSMDETAPSVPKSIDLTALALKSV